MFIRIFGKLFADVRNIGYNKKNILIAARNRYVNEPTHVVQGKSLEAACPSDSRSICYTSFNRRGRLVGDIIDYKGNPFRVWNSLNFSTSTTCW